MFLVISLSLLSPALNFQVSWEIMSSGSFGTELELINEEFYVSSGAFTL